MTADEAIAEAQCLRQNGEYDGAWHILADLLQVYPESPAICVLLGDTLAKLGRLEEAELVMANAVKLAPASETASLSLFHLLWESDKKTEALEEMKRYMCGYGSDEYKEILKGLTEELDP